LTSYLAFAGLLYLGALRSTETSLSHFLQ
jgi:hypothetical protein